MCGSSCAAPHVLGWSAVMDSFRGVQGRSTGSAWAHLHAARGGQLEPGIKLLHGARLRHLAGKNGRTRTTDELGRLVQPLPAAQRALGAWFVQAARLGRAGLPPPCTTQHTVHTLTRKATLASPHIRLIQALALLPAPIQPLPPQQTSNLRSNTP